MLLFYERVWLRMTSFLRPMYDVLLVACPKTQRSHKCGRHKKEKKKGKEKWTREAHPVVVIMAEDLAVSYFAQIARVIIKLS